MPASSCPPSSSATTIPTPGKSILKRSQSQPSSLLSRITRFLPNPNQTQTDESKPLKRAHFILPYLVTVYPISSLNPPSTPSLKEEKKAIEDKEAERRRRIIKGGSLSGCSEDHGNDWWSLDKVESFYRECCATSEEEPDPTISLAFMKNASGGHLRCVDFSGVQLTPGSACILSDVFTIEWGLRKLIFRECELDHRILKPLLHALLIPNSLIFLSVASNRRLTSPAFRLIGAFVAKSKHLQFLDLSQNALDKKSVEHLTTALPTAPNPGLISLRLDDCSLRPSALEILARAVRTSSLRNISLRHNRINATGAVAIALMIKDYPDIVPQATSSPSPELDGSPSVSPIARISDGTPPESPKISSSPIPRVPPRHPVSSPYTTYTPYVPRSRRTAGSPTRPHSHSTVEQHHIPIITSSPQGGVTTRHPVPPVPESHATGSLSHHSQGPSVALLDKVRALDTLPRLGALQTLDLRGNDLRTGIMYIAQVLKRNRTLKLLNLSENKLDVQCLISIADALKYNSCLETLDLNRNPCSGPGLEGIQSLRTAFTLNTALKRLFLSSTSMTSAGAIALAEFLPESTSLLHLDLTMNQLDIAGVMALSSGLKSNHTMRCLDLNIPPGDEEFARMCREILSSCVRNTEEAEKASRNVHQTSPGREPRKNVWGMIEESKLAKTIRQEEAQKAETDIATQAQTVAAELKASASITTLDSSSLVSISSSTIGDSMLDLAKTILVNLDSAIHASEHPLRLEELLHANDELTEALAAVAARDAGHDGVPRENGQLRKENDEKDSVDPLVSETIDKEKVDKGKARAQVDPLETEKILSPGLMAESEDEDEDGERSRSHPGTQSDDAQIPSPIDRSRSWVEEEGEIFRKGAVLLSREQMEGDFAGEELRKELLEAMVERPPPRALDDFDLGETANPLPPSLEPS